MSDYNSVIKKLYEKYSYKKKKEEQLLKDVLQSYPALYWAKYYHVNTRNERMNFNKMFYLLELYKIIDSTPKLCIEKSVQMGLSELFIIQSHIEAGLKGLTVMYVMPKYELRNRFVNNRIYKLHKRVNAYKKLVARAETKVHRTSLMHFGKGTLAYVGSNVKDEFVEIPVDSAYVDEKDRCNQENLLMLPDRLSASPYKFHREISNPTVEDFGIDERFKISSQAYWNIKCPHCGKWFTPDFFKHVVMQVGDNKYVLRDKEADPDPDSGGNIRLIHDCGKPVDRLAEGEWVHSYPNKEWKGFQISKVYGKFASLRGLYRQWVSAVGNDLKVQIFFNSDLGLPYSSKGAKITISDLNKCKRNYKLPVKRLDSAHYRFMGVDVGKKLHVIIRERIVEDDKWVLRLIYIGSVPSFSIVASLIREYRPRMVVIDAMPEIHKVMELKNEFSNVWSSRFEDSAMTMTKNKNTREVRMNRTALLDYVKQGIELETLILPINAEFLDNGDYYNHMTASTRILEVNESNIEKSKFVWVHAKPDHYFLAESYCLQANMLVPANDVFEFFREQSSLGRKIYARKKVYNENIPIEQKEDILRLKTMTPEIVFSSLQSNYASSKQVKPKIDYDLINDIIDSLYKNNRYVDIFIASKMCGVSSDIIKKELDKKGFVESKISNQYVKNE